MKFTLTKKVEVEREVVEKIIEEFLEFIDDRGFLKIHLDDLRTHTDLAQEFIEERNRIFQGTIGS